MISWPSFILGALLGAAAAMMLAAAITSFGERKKK